MVEINWKAHHPYPTNPFKRVDGKELEKLHRQAQKDKINQLPKAPF